MPTIGTLEILGRSRERVANPMDLSPIAARAAVTSICQPPELAHPGGPIKSTASPLNPLKWTIWGEIASGVVGGVGSARTCNAGGLIRFGHSHYRSLGESGLRTLQAPWTLSRCLQRVLAAKYLLEQVVAVA